MTLSEYILENTDDGIDIAAVLIDVMNGFIRGVRPSHRLTAARLLTIYGFQDARDFIDDNVPQSSGERQQWVISDPELARLIRARTNDGQEMCLFLIDVMWGKVEGLRIGHRVSAARELLDRAFGRNQGIPLPNPPQETAPRGTIPRADQKTDSAPVPPVENPHQQEPNPREPVDAQVQTTTVRPVENPPRRELVEGQVQTEPVHPESVRPEPVEGHPEANPNFNPDIYRAASWCIDPYFDPMRAASDDDYWSTYDGCDNISCPYHGDPEDPDFDPNAHHY